MRKTDILVIGGGPAGLAFAIEARFLGFDVTIVDRGRTSHIYGEVLNSRAKYTLQRLGVYENFIRAHKPVAGKRIYWGTNKLREINTIFSPFGDDWLVDRTKFEHLLRERAASLDVQLIMAHILDIRRELDSWIVVLRSGLSINSKFIVDASGRSMWLSRRIGSSPVIVDGLVAVSLFSKCSNSSTFFEVESLPEGWLYRTPLPEGGCMLMLMTDKDLIPANIFETVRTSRLGKSLTLVKGQVRPAHTAYSPLAAGSGWATIGDASLAWDPLAGQGIASAIESAHLLANALKKGIKGDDSSLEEYTQIISKIIKKYLVERAAIYKSENRWKEFPFWERRH